MIDKTISACDRPVNSVNSFMLIGITGQIGAGKSTAAEIMAELGAHVIDADEIGKKVVNKSEQLRKRLAHRFGADILDKRGRLKRKKLAQLAFVSERSRDALNRLVHPFLLWDLLQEMKVANKTYELVVVDAALLLHWNLDRKMDHVLVIHAERELRFRRLKKRGISRADALAREKAQLPYREFQIRSDRLILNSGTVRQLRRILVQFLDEIQRQSG